jgi:hypothetical protein
MRNYHSAFKHLLIIAFFIGMGFALQMRTAGLMDFLFITCFAAFWVVVAVVGASIIWKSLLKLFQWLDG